MNPLAKELNDVLSEKANLVFQLLSEFGKEIFFPKGILSQSQEAKQKAHKFNATLGIAADGNGPLFLPSIQKYVPELDPKDVFPYAPAAGKPEFRKAWQDKIFKDNPSLNGKKISTPIITIGITHGLSLVADLFTNPGDTIILPNHFWGNYRLIFSVRYGANIENYEFFNSNNGFNIEAFEQCLDKIGKEKKKMTIILNSPNNPTGYTPTVKEAEQIKEILFKQADKGNQILFLTDDAYFGLFYEDTAKESLFGQTTGGHDNILSIKLDGATKEEYVWGFRTGAITFGLGNLENADEVYPALEKKVMGAIRSKLSNASHLSQTLVLKALESPTHEKEKAEKFEIMQKRALKVKEVLQDSKFDPVWYAYPFNSGYFMCLQLKTVNAEKLRVHLLDKYGVGIISINDQDIRIAFSCVDVNNVQELFDIIYQGIKDIE